MGPGCTSLFLSAFFVVIVSAWINMHIHTRGLHIAGMDGQFRKGLELLNSSTHSVPVSSRLAVSACTQPEWRTWSKAVDFGLLAQVVYLHRHKSPERDRILFCGIKHIAKHLAKYTPLDT